jgi:hypothetical protein
MIGIVIVQFKRSAARSRRWRGDVTKVLAARGSVLVESPG